MLDYIKGMLVSATPMKAVVEVNGLGYALHIALSTYSKLPQQGQEALFFISTVIREDSHKLYGFLSASERDLFERLNEISGIGPKTSLALLGHLDPAELQMAIAAANVSLISKAPGIGKKTAERLIIEMRDKVLLPAATSQPSGISVDAIAALIHLGYNPLQAQKAVKSALQNSSKEPSLSELITLSLKTI
jgi:Holliday junction DNA helicase RuvA